MRQIELFVHKNLSRLTDRLTELCKGFGVDRPDDGEAYTALHEEVCRELGVHPESNDGVILNEVIQELVFADDDPTWMHT